MNQPDPIGQRFGLLVVDSVAYWGKHGRYYLCRCDCGDRNTVRRDHLIGGRIRSCGCLIVTHGLLIGWKQCGKPDGEASWRGIKDRCENPRAKDYARYGGRGITVCKRWSESLPDFLADMGPRPSAKHSIDRIDVNGNYEPGNCRWATDCEQNRNKRNNALTPELVAQIRAMQAEGRGVSEIARSIGRKVTTVHCVMQGRTWRDEPAPELCWARAA